MYVQLKSFIFRSSLCLDCVYRNYLVDDDVVVLLITIGGQRVRKYRDKTFYLVFDNSSK